MNARFCWISLAIVFGNGCRQERAGQRKSGPPGDTLAIESLASLPNLTLNGQYALTEPVDTLRVRRVFEDSLQFEYVTQLAVLGQSLVAVDQFTSPHVAVINTSTGAIETRLGVYGSKPRQLKTPSSLIASSGGSTRAWIYDFDTHKLMSIQKKRDGWVEDDSIVSFNLAASLQTPVQTKGGFIANGLFDDYTLLVMDITGKPTREISARPPFSEPLVDHINGRRMLNRNFLVIDPLHTRIALVYQFANRVDLFSPNGQAIGSIVTPRSPRLHYDFDSRKFFWRPGNEVGYSAATGTSHFIYALYCGCGLGREYPPSVLHVFAWDGAFVGEIQLDRPVSAIAVSANDSILFGGSMGPGAKLMEWRLPRWRKTGPQAPSPPASGHHQ